MLSSTSVLLLLVVSYCCCGGGGGGPMVVQAFARTAPYPPAAVTIRIYENDTVQLPCHLDDTGLITRVRWFRDGSLLADSEDPNVAEARPRVNMWGNQTLELVQVRPEDNGNYHCQVDRPEPWGNVIQAHEIQVMYPASAKPIPASGLLEVDLGQEVEMQCETGGHPKPKLSWRFGGEELPTLASEQRSLRILVSNQSLAGVYTCVANNGVDEPARADIELKIKHKPEVTATNRSVYGAPGMKVELQCQVVAWPEAKLEWWFDGERLKDNSSRYYRSNGDLSQTVHLHTLSIKRLRVSDLGQYACHASNEKGRTEASIEVLAVPKPPKPLKASRTEGSYLIMWLVESYSPIVQYQLWFKRVGPGEGEADQDWRRLTIPSTTEPPSHWHWHSFNLTGLNPKHSYEALVLAKNRYGWSSPSKVIRLSSSDPENGGGGGGEGEGEELEYERRIDGGVSEEIPSVVQVTSDSHRSEASSSAKNSPADFLLPLLILFPILLFRTTSVSRIHCS